MENKKCVGCGSVLQTEDAMGRGYAKSIENDYCQSCFRLKHYRDFKRVKADVNDGTTLEFIERFDGHILWVLDIMHLNQSMHTGLLRALRNKSVVLVVNKRDLLPKSVSNNKLTNAIMRALKNEDVSLMDVVYVSALKKNTLEALTPYLEDAPCAFVGCVNAGKSSLLNALMGKNDLSVSPVASTTADVLHIETEHYDVYDTPGLSNESELLSKFTDENLVMLAPQKTLKPAVYQLYEKQTILLGNLGAITVTPKSHVHVVSYLPFELKRIKPERLEANFELDHDFMIQNPSYRKKKWPVTDKHIDIEIFDVGFISIQGELKELETRFDKEAEVVIRKAII
ncbi:GTPase [Erysipelothrix sp. strain 2 (EsS2-6-Brazil)]|uniref:GTPase n=1 Tax=Erysipelothrix sp. strain 2 (EsS2-6-Brazil) TaxID=2500549 RepID=UPI00190B8F08|nr:GTPase [Erysipelothrix sp. strain 2 (EsS2-6-Brazil)]MBK2402390.1 GTPase RsgA [Erysipelothrix sp. strain 2 (EsS2-6-Brazil)]